MNELTQAILCGVLDYDKESGVFTWRFSVSATAQKGHRAGGVAGNGYRRIGLLNLNYQEHRLAWLYVYGRWPADQINHKNGRKDDNRIANLEESSPSENTRHAFAIGLASAAGDRNGRAKLSWADVDDIRGSDKPTRALMDQYHVDKRTIERARAGTTWARV